ncbi:hypothetical protein LINGRAHAP2_LOCUS20946 [Linum grandiflorum]
MLPEPAPLPRHEDPDGLLPDIVSRASSQRKFRRLSLSVMFNSSYPSFPLPFHSCEAEVVSPWKPIKENSSDGSSDFLLNYEDEDEEPLKLQDARKRQWGTAEKGSAMKLDKENVMMAVDNSRHGLNYWIQSGEEFTLSPLE